MNFTEAASFAAAAPFIAAVVGFIKSFVTIPSRLIPAVTMALAFAWGGILWASALWEGVPALFVLTAFTIGMAANGMQSVARTFVPLPNGPGTPPRP